MRSQLSWFVVVALACGTTGLAQAVAGPGTKTSTTQATFSKIAADAAGAREGGRLEEAVVLYRRGLRMRPSWDEGHWYLGTVLYEQQRYVEARAVFAQLLKRQPAHAGAMALTGLCAFGQGELEAALRALLKARQLNIQQTAELADVVRYHTAILLTRFSEFEAGNQVLTELPADGMESPRVVEAFGLNLLRMPIVPDEIPSAARARVRLAGEAAVAMATRQASPASTLLDRLVAEYPGTPNVHYARGVFQLTAEPVRALADWRRELEVSPSHVPARLQIAAELLKQGDPTSALPFAQAAVQIAPQEFAPRLTLGQVLLSTGDIPAAIVELEMGVTLAAESAQAHYLLAVAYARAGRSKDADRERALFARLGGSATVQGVRNDPP